MSYFQKITVLSFTLSLLSMTSSFAMDDEAREETGGAAVRSAPTVEELQQQVQRLQLRLDQADETGAGAGAGKSDDKKSKKKKKKKGWGKRLEKNAKKEGRRLEKNVRKESEKGGQQVSNFLSGDGARTDKEVKERARRAAPEEREGSASASASRTARVDEDSPVPFTSPTHSNAGFDVTGTLDTGLVFAAADSGISRFWIHPDAKGEAKEHGYEQKPYTVEEGQEVRFSFNLSGLTGRIGAAFVSSEGQALGEKSRLTNGIQTIAITVPEGVTGMTPMVYCSNGEASFKLENINVAIK